MPTLIEVNKISVKYGNNVVFKDISFNIGKSEFFVLLGPSGCGKTTILNLIAGFIKLHRGKIYLEGKEINKPGPDRGVIFQNSESALFPWMTVKENAEFGLKIRNVCSKEERNRLVQIFLKKVNLEEHQAKYPNELSGGMKQRLQLARTLVMIPPVILMDEPFANLDAQTRRLMQLELTEIWMDTKNTIFYITHDIREAVLLAQKIAVMSSGRNSGAIIKGIYTLNGDYPRDLRKIKYVNLIREIEQSLAEEVKIG